MFNILMHRLLTSLLGIPGAIIVCYADDIYVHTTWPRHLQQFLSFSSVASLIVLELFPQMRQG